MLTTSDLESALESVGLVPGLSAAEVHRRLEEGLHLEETGQRILAFYLVEMQEKGLHQDTGHSSAVHYAEEKLQIDRRRAGELIAVGRKLLTVPKIDAAFCRREIGWSKVVHLVGVVSPEHEEAWLDVARFSTVRELGKTVRCSAPGGPPHRKGRRGIHQPKYRYSFAVSKFVHTKAEQAKAKLSAEEGRPLKDSECLERMAEMVLGSDADGNVPGRTRVDSSQFLLVVHRDGEDGPMHLDTEEGLVPLTENEAACLLCDAEVIRAEDGTEHHAPPTPPWMRRRVLARDGNRCRCCGSRRLLMAHHIRFRSHGGPTRMSNLIAVCVTCHSLIHDGLLAIEGETADAARFVDKDGVPLDARSVHRLSLPTLEPPPPGALPQSPPPVTVPERVDAAWWRRHADLLEMNDEEVVVGEGTPLPEEAVPPPAPAAVVPFEEAFAGVLGQEQLLDRIERAGSGGRRVGKPFPHALLSGAPGIGKSRIAQGVAAWVGGAYVRAVGPLLQSVTALLQVLVTLREGTVLFLDEVHAVPRKVLEALYDAMSERCLSMAIRVGSTARQVRFDLPAFTLVAATTDPGQLPPALLSRFVVREDVQAYDPEDLAKIAVAATPQGVALEGEAARRLARASRGTPREALRLLDLVVRDAASEGKTSVGTADAEAALRRLGYDATGLSPMDQRYLGLLRRRGRPMSLATIARCLDTDAARITRDVEPELLRRGLVDVTPLGRVALPEPASQAAPRAPNVRQEDARPRGQLLVGAFGGVLA